MLESLMLAQLGVLLKEVVGPVAKAAAEDWCKDRLKAGANEVLALSAPDALKKAVKQALKNFIRLFGDELENCGLTRALIKHELAEPLGHLLATESVLRELCRAFETDVKDIDWQVLPSVWRTLSAPANFPKEFEWDELARNYVRRVKGLVRKDEKLARQLELDQQQAIKKSNEALVGVPVQFNLREYQESLKERFGSLSLDSLDTTGAAYDNLRLWKIFVAQDVRECAEFAPQMYELPKERLLELQAAGEIDPLLSLDELDQRRRRYAEKPIESVRGVVGLEGADSVLRSVILGDPGSGKSTLLRALALSWADIPLAALKGEPIPLLIELRLYAQDKEKGICNDFLEYLHRGNTACRLNQLELDALLESGKAVALFDGVDEVFDPQLREAVVTDIHRFSNRYPVVQMVVTSRWLGYKAEALRKAEFAHYMLQDLNDEQIEDFLERWHGLTFAKGQKVERERKQGRLQKAIGESKAIRELAGNPLLLTMMAILNRNQELPRDRARLYEEASKVLLYQWDVEGKLYEQEDLKHWQIDVRDKQAMLRKVAHHMQANENGLSGNVISRDDLEEILTDYLKKRDVDRARPVARVMIEQLRERNFILCYLGADNYAFVHRTFLEYFCASEFVYQFEKERTLSEESLKELYRDKCRDKEWREILRLIAGVIEPRFIGRVINNLIKQEVTTDILTEQYYSIQPSGAGAQLLSRENVEHIILAIDCLSEVKTRHSLTEAKKNLLSFLIEGEEHAFLALEPEASKIFIEAIATLWENDNRIFPWLKKCLKIGDQFSCFPALALHSLAKHWRNVPETKNIVKSHARDSQNKSVLVAAIIELSGWRTDSDMLSIVELHAEKNENRHIRHVALRELVLNWTNSPNTLDIIKNSALKDDDYNIRSDSIAELTISWKIDSEILDIVKHALIFDVSPRVRGTAVRVLTRRVKDYSDVLITLKSCAEKDRDSKVRYAAIDELAHGWDSDPTLFEFWCDRTLKDPFKRQYDIENNPRQIALEVLVRQYPGHPKTIELLRDRSQNDIDEYFCVWAIKQLSRLVSASS